MGLSRNARSGVVKMAPLTSPSDGRGHFTIVSTDSYRTSYQACSTCHRNQRYLLYFAYSSSRDLLVRISMGVCCGRVGTSARRTEGIVMAWKPYTDSPSACQLHHHHNHAHHRFCLDLRVLEDS